MTQATPTLCLDLGTHTGFSIGDVTSEPVPSISGTKTLASKEELAVQRKIGRERTGDCRYSRLLELLRKMVAEHQIAQIIFEDVPFAGSQMQAQLWSSLRTAIWQLNLEQPNLKVYDVHPLTLKKWATGSGKADKAAMARALAVMHPQFHASIDGRIYNEQGVELDDNEIDSIWIYLYAQHIQATGGDWGSVAARRAEKKQERKQTLKLRRFAQKLKQTT